MEDSLKHIDELFRSQLGSTGITPPSGVFEQCMNQLHGSAGIEQTQSINASQTAASSPSTGTSVYWGKSMFGLSAKASGLLLAAVVTGAVGFAVYLLQGEGVKTPSWVDSAEKLHPATAENSRTTIETDESQSHVSVSSKRQSSSSEAGQHLLGATSNNHPSSAAASLRDIKLQAVTSAQGGSNFTTSGGAIGDKAKVGNENFEGVSKDKLISGNAGPKPVENQTLPTRINKVSQKNTSPCGSTVNQWKPVISDVVGGLVSLGVEGQYERIRLDWSDGEKADYLVNQVGVERVSHQYWVDHARTFQVRLLNERRVVDERGNSLLCKDSQIVSVNILPSGDATDVFVPDIFTPNGDGLNEEFYIGMAEPQMFDMCVFDFNNRLIFRSDKYDAKWKGFCGSSVCPEGIYRVVISYKYSGDKSLKYARKSVKLINNSNR